MTFLALEESHGTTVAKPIAPSTHARVGAVPKPCATRRVDQWRGDDTTRVSTCPFHKRSRRATQTTQTTQTSTHPSLIMSLEMFTVPSADVSREGYRMVTYSPSATRIRPVTFTVQGVDDFVDLDRSYLEIELRLRSPSVNGLGADANAASTANDTKFLYAVNNIGHSLFKQMNLRFNGALMSEQTDTYAYKAFIETVLNYNRQEGDTLLAPQGWVNQLDVVPRLEAAGVNDDKPTTPGWVHNAAQPLKTATVKFHGGNVVTLIVHPHLEAFHTGRLLVPGVEMVLELFCNSPDFFIFGTKTSGTGVKRMITLDQTDLKVTLHLCRVSLNPTVYAALQAERKSKRRSAKYPVVRSEIRSFSFDGRTTRFSEDNVFLSKVPDRVIVAMVDSQAFNGDVEWYPFAFQKFGATRTRQIVDGEEYPYPALELNGGDGLKDLKGYHRFLEACGRLAHHGPSMVNPSVWGHDGMCTFFMFNNVPSGLADDASHRNPKQAGNVRIEIDFSANPNVNLTVLVWGEFENLFEVDGNGVVLYNLHR